MYILKVNYYHGLLPYLWSGIHHGYQAGNNVHAKPLTLLIFFCLLGSSFHSWTILFVMRLITLLLRGNSLIGVQTTPGAVM